MAIVQVKSQTGTAVSTISVTLTSVGAGDALIAVVRAGAVGITIDQPTDNGGANTWVQVGTQLSGSAGNAGNCISIWYVQASSGTVTSATFTTSIAGVPTVAIIQAFVYEVSGQAASILDQHSESATDNSGTALAVPSFTPGVAASLVIAGYSTTAAKTFTAGTNYTIQTNGSQSRSAVEDRELSSASAQTCPMTINTSGNWVGRAASFKLSSNTAPTIVLNSTDTTTTDTTPPVDVTGSDVDGDDLTYEWQWANNPAFTNAVTLGANQTTASSASIHPNPSITAGPNFVPTWEGAPYYQVDDRPFQAVVGIDGTLDHVDWYLGNDPNNGGPIGFAQCRVYAVYGTKTAALSVSSITRVGTTATVTTAAPHTLLNGQSVIVAGAAQGGYNIRAQIAVTGASTFTYTVDGATVTPATGTITVTGGYAPLNAVAPSLTPTHGWLAQSDDLAFTPSMSTSNAYYSFTFTGAQRIRMVDGTIYGIEFNWVPEVFFFGPSNDDNTLVVQGNTNLASYASGNAYIDGNSVNCGVRTDFVFTFRVYEALTVDTFNSSTDPGFLNTVVGGDTSPFTPDQKIRYTAQSAMALGTWWGRGRTKDAGGSNTWSSYTATVVYTITAPSPSSDYWIGELAMPVIQAQPFNRCKAITTSNTVNYDGSTYAANAATKPMPAEAIYVGGAGDVVAVFEDGTTATFTCVAGQTLSIKTIRVNATSTTATLLVGMYTL